MTDANRTSDEIGLQACSYFSRFGFLPQDVEDVMVTSVVPQVMYTLNNAITRYFGRRPIVIDRDVDPGLHYESDERLGADRAVACIAAAEKYGSPVIVLDFGTTTTVDTVDEKGWYQGGCILAGLRVTADALFHKAALLTRVELAKPEKMLGFSAVTQIQGGLVGGYVGAVEYLVRAARRETGFGARAKVVATGGLARMIADGTDLIDVVDGRLILDGLRIIYERYRGARS